MPTHEINEEIEDLNNTIEKLENEVTLFGGVLAKARTVTSQHYDYLLRTTLLPILQMADANCDDEDTVGVLNKIAPIIYDLVKHKTSERERISVLMEITSSSWGFRSDPISMDFWTIQKILEEENHVILEEMYRYLGEEGFRVYAISIVCHKFGPLVKIPYTMRGNVEEIAKYLRTHISSYS